MKNSKGNNFLAIVFIVLGAIFLAKNLGFIEIKDVLRTYWPAALIIIGIGFLLKSPRSGKSK
jgi:hypothetical protein